MGGKIVNRASLKPSAALVLVAPVLVAHGGDDDSLAGAGMDEPVPFQVDSHVVDFPEAAEEHEVAFAEVAPADLGAAGVLVHPGRTVVQRDVVVTLVDLHHEAGAVRPCLGRLPVGVLGSHPSAGVVF